MSDVDAWLDAGQRPETSIGLCLAGNLQQAYADKAADLATLLDDKNRSMADGSKIRDMRDELEELREKMAAATRTLTLRAMDPDTYYLLVLDHPPRKGHQLDQAHGINFDTFTPLIVHQSIADPPMTGKQFAALRAKLNPQQWTALWQTAFSLNRDEVALPKSLPAFGTTESSGDGSSKPEPSASASNGSTGGNRSEQRTKKKTA